MLWGFVIHSSGWPGGCDARVDSRSGSLFSYVDLEARVRRDHPLRVIREIANAALLSLSEDFSALYPPRLGRPSVPPERLLRAMLLQAFYGLRSERQHPGGGLRAVVGLLSLQGARAFHSRQPT